LHSKCCRKKRNPKLYFTLVKVLLDKGYRVYLTDIFKIWVSSTDRNKENKFTKNSLQKTDGRRFAKVLENEKKYLSHLKLLPGAMTQATHLKNKK
jgi:hypothetical protein